MAKISALPVLGTPTGNELVPVISGGLTHQAAFRPLVEAAAAGSVSAAQAAANVALAASRYFATRAAGEAATAVDGLFATDDGVGTLIYFRRIAAGSVEIARSRTGNAVIGRAALKRAAVLASIGDVLWLSEGPRSGAFEVVGGVAPMLDGNEGRYIAIDATRHLSRLVVDDAWRCGWWGIAAAAAGNDNRDRLVAALTLVPIAAQLWLPPGDTPIGTGVRMRRDDIVLCGSGRRTCSLTGSAGAVPLTLWGNNIDIRGIHFRGSGAVSFANSNMALMLGNAFMAGPPEEFYGWRVDDCGFSGTPIGLLVSASYSTDTVPAGSRARDVEISNCHSEGQAQGYSMFAVKRVTVTDCTVEQKVLPDQRSTDCAMRIIGTDYAVVDGFSGPTSGNYGFHLGAMKNDNFVKEVVRFQNRRIVLKNVDLTQANVKAIFGQECTESLTLDNVEIVGSRGGANGQSTAVSFDISATPDNPQPSFGRVAISNSRFEGYCDQISVTSGALRTLSAKGSRFVSNKNAEGYPARLLIRVEYASVGLIDVTECDFPCAPLTNANALMRLFQSSVTVRLYRNNLPEGAPALLYDSAGTGNVTVVGRPAGDQSYATYNNNNPYSAGTFAAFNP